MVVVVTLKKMLVFTDIEGFWRLEWYVLFFYLILDWANESKCQPKEIDISFIFSAANL